MTSLQTSLETLLRTALLGTAREGNSLQLDGALGRFGQSKNGPEAALLGAAAAVTLGTRAGQLPGRSEASAMPLCPQETQPYFSPRAAALLESCLSGSRELVPQALFWAAQSGQIAPPALLVPLLEFGRGSKSVRRTLAPILGERGRWLAQQNPDWRQVAAPIDAGLEASWEDGELAARREALRLKREQSPEVAREWVEAAFPAEGAKERAQWLETLEVGLSQADEEFLERALDDKSKEVRAVAVSLLEKLPDSRLVGRAKTELEPLLRWNSASQIVEVELPAAWKKEWARDGLEEKVSAYNRVRNLGERAAWLRRWISRVPTSYWEKQWSATPAQIVAGAPREWRDLLLGAWWDAAKIAGDSRWGLAILEVCDDETIRRLLAFGDMKAAFADALSLSLFGRKDQEFGAQNALFALLQAHPGPWSLDVARQFLARAQESLARYRKINNAPLHSQYHWLRYTLPSLADKMPLEMAAEAAQGWPQSDDGEDWQPVIFQFIARLQLRADLQTEFSQSELSLTLQTPS